MPARSPNQPFPIRAALLSWYGEHRRDLPWRRARPDPYHVLVSEAMLQQTQVTTVIAYFERFIAAFPGVAALAAADEQRVLRLWQGLGYYRRARNLHAAARAMMADHAGSVPDSVEALSALPGVGRYTAGAVASIAFGRRAPILDGNVARVLARWFAITEPIDRPKVRARLWRMAARLVPAERPGDFNQAMMELGALVCLPRQPRCLLCPIAPACRAKRLGLAEQVPARLPRRAPRPVEHHVLAIRQRGRVLLEQRPDRGLWSGMWQLPTSESLKPPATPAAIRRWGEDHLGLKLGLPERLEAFTHQTTHKTIRFVVWKVEVKSGKLKRGAGVWRRVDEVDDLPLANPQRRVLVMLEGMGG